MQDADFVNAIQMYIKDTEMQQWFSLKVGLLSGFSFHLQSPLNFSKNFIISVWHTCIENVMRSLNLICKSFSFSVYCCYWEIRHIFPTGFEWKAKLSKNFLTFLKTIGPNSFFKKNLKTNEQFQNQPRISARFYLK